MNTYPFSSQLRESIHNDSKDGIEAKDTDDNEERYIEEKAQTSYLVAHRINGDCLEG